MTDRRKNEKTAVGSGGKPQVESSTGASARPATDMEDHNITPVQPGPIPPINDDPPGRELASG